MSSFGYSVLGFGTVATAAVSVSAPDTAIIKDKDGSNADNVTVELVLGPPFGTIETAAPRSTGSSATDYVEIDVSSDLVRFSATKTVNGTVATHAWQAIITHTTGSGGTFVGGSATDTSSTSGTYTTAFIDGSSLTGGFTPDAGTITFKYTATNAGGSDAADDVVIYWQAAG